MRRERVSSEVLDESWDEIGAWSSAGQKRNRQLPPPRKCEYRYCGKMFNGGRKAKRFCDAVCQMRESSERAKGRKGHTRHEKKQTTVKRCFFADSRYPGLRAGPVATDPGSGGSIPPR